MPRFQLLLGSHIDRDPKVEKRENETYEEFDKRSFRHFYWNNPERNVVDTEVDLEQLYNKPGYEKFRRLTDFVVAQPNELADRVLVEELVARGMMSREEAEKRLQEKRGGGNVSTTTPPTAEQLATSQKSAVPLDPSQVANNREQKVKDTLANLGKMNKQGLEQFAADEEVDVSGCKSDEQMRQAIRKHFGK